MVNGHLSLRKDYWETLEITPKDIVFLNNHLFELETPLTTQELTRALVSERIRLEKQALQNQQLAFEFTEDDKDQRIQFEQDRKHMSARLSEIDGEIETQPRDIEGLYQVMLRRLEPVGLVYLWPSTR